MKKIINKKNNTFYFIKITLLLIISSITSIINFEEDLSIIKQEYADQTKEKKDNIDYKKEKEIHIFVHGTETFGEAGTPKALWRHIYSKFMFLNTNKEIYKNQNEYANFKNRFMWLVEKNFPLVSGLYPGLHKITHIFNNCSEKNKCRHCISQKAYDQIFSLFKDKIEKNNRTDNSYYMFNWAGNLSNIDRRLAAEKLALDLAQLQTEDMHSHINLYGHSHGGNVILEALAIAKEKKSPLNIKNIYTLAMPIGKITKIWLQKISYENLYNFYSTQDKTQISDYTFDASNAWHGNRNVTEINSRVYNIVVTRLDDKKITHELFFLPDNKYTIYPVICDLPDLLSQFKKKIFMIKKYDSFYTNKYKFTIC